MKIKKITFAVVILLSIIPFVSCSKYIKNQSNEIKIEENQQTESMDTNDYSSNEPETNDVIQENEPPNTVNKIEGRKSEFIEKLNNIQLELDSLPLKKDSDAGITNAMRSYYGISYDMYDKALNDIYALLENQLSSEIMQNLQNEQIEWIKEKEAIANKEAEKYKGGTFEFVAYNSSLYETTKNRCYELVNLYMTY